MKCTIEKKPRFSYNENFSFGQFGGKFNFVLAQSIFSHTQWGLAAKCLNNIPDVLDDSGLVACTFLLPHQVEKKDLNVLGDSWVYPECVGFSEELIHQLFDAVGLHAWKLNWFHPRQTWYVASKNPNALTTEDIAGLTGYRLHSADP